MSKHTTTKPAAVNYHQVPRNLWRRVKRQLPPEPPPAQPGRPRIANRPVLNGIWYILWTGCQWKAVHRDWFGVSSSVLHERFQTWQELGIWDKVFQTLVKFYRRERRIQWRWQAVDSRSCAAPLGGSQTGKNPTDRANWAPKSTFWSINGVRRWPSTSVAPINMTSGPFRIWCSMSPCSAPVPSNISAVTRATTMLTCARRSRRPATSHTSNGSANAASQCPIRVLHPAKPNSQPGAGWSNALWAGWQSGVVCGPVGARNPPTG